MAKATVTAAPKRTQAARAQGRVDQTCSPANGFESASNNDLPKGLKGIKPGAVGGAEFAEEYFRDLMRKPRDMALQGFIDDIHMHAKSDAYAKTLDKEDRGAVCGFGHRLQELILEQIERAKHEKRRRLMNEWAKFCETTQQRSGGGVPLRRKA